MVAEPSDLVECVVSGGSFQSEYATMRMRLRHAKDSTSWTVGNDDKDSISAATKESAHHETEPSTSKDTDDSREFRDVWYRRFLKPFSPYSSVSLRQAFQQRVLHPVGIPVEQVTGLHDLFLKECVHLSPLMGLIFTYNNFINNLYRYGDDTREEPAVALVRSLFHVLPGGEIQATHLGSSAGAHLSPDLIGKILEKSETLRPRLVLLKRDDGRKLLYDEVLHLIANHSEYRASRDKLLLDVKSAELHLASLHERDVRSKQYRDKIKDLEGLIVKRCRHALKRLKSQLKTTDAASSAGDKIKAEMTVQQEAIDNATTVIEELRSNIVTSLQYKSAKKDLRRAQEMIDLEKGSRTQLVQTLVECFYCYDPNFSLPSRTLPLNTTSTILLAYLWRKYDNICFFKGYMESMFRMGALRPMMWSVEDEFKSNMELVAIPTPMDASRSIRRHTDWSSREKAMAAIISISKPGIARRPPVVQFSYVRWADYSEFPDCGETALRNLFNQLLYNPQTGMFDHELLLELRNQFYPSLHQPLIDFFRAHPNPNDAADHSISMSWIDVVSGLNKATPSGPRVRYRREKQEQNIASPLSNLLCVVSALFGATSPSNVDGQRRAYYDGGLGTVVNRINQLRKLNLQVDSSGLKADGFGIVGISVDNVRYELQSYKPVHFGFVQVESPAGRDRATISSGRFDYEVFYKLLQHCNRRIRKEWSNEIEELALSSLFVPYMIQTNKTHGGFLDVRCPPHYWLLFANLYQSPSQQAAILRWAQQDHPGNNQLAGYIDRIRRYQEPTFLPPS